MSDDQIVQWILNGGQQRELAVSHLLNTHIALMHRTRRKFGFTREEASDVYTDSLLDFTANVIRGKFQAGKSVRPYLKTIIFRKGADGYAKKRNSKMTPLSEEYELMDETPDLLQKYIEADRIEQLNLCLERLGARCRLLLKLFYFSGYPYEEIAESMGFKTANVAKNAKYRCVKELKNICTEKVK